MLNPPLTEKASVKFEQDFADILFKYNDDAKLLKNQQEVFSVWWASPFIRRVCVAQPQFLENLFIHGELHADYDEEKYQQLLNSAVENIESVELLQRQLRKTRLAAFARIAWRDIQQYTTVQQILYELSTFADVCIKSTLQWCFDWLQSRPYANEFVKALPQNIVIFALGKLGGQELNFSSDVDIVFAYNDEKGYTQEEAGKATEFYLKVVQLFIKVLTEQTQHGFVFRVDTRLRPFGNSGALLPSYSSIDQYFQTHGRDWERYAWMKARVIAGNMQAGEQFLQEITPFIYRRYLDFGAMQALREMKALVDTKARHSSAKENLKIGFGGIREIEFITQMFQLIYGGKDVSLQIRSTLQALQQLQSQGLLTPDWVGELTAAYLFLRKAENGLQLREDQQIHTLPIETTQQIQFAYLMNKPDWQVFYTEYKKHTNTVNTIYQLLLTGDTDVKETTHEENQFDKLWLQIDDSKYCLNILNNIFADNAEHVYQQLNSFAQSSLIQKLTPVARGRLDKFIPIFLQQLLQQDESIVVFDRFLNILKKIAQRSTYVSLLIENKNKLSIIFSLIQVSPWIAQYLATHPLLLDEILSLDASYKPPSMVEMQQQLSAMMSADIDLEKYMENLREFKHSQVIQIAAADVVENYPIMKVSDHLSWLAETCINSAVQFAYQELLEKYGAPRCIVGGQTYTPEVLIVEYGKLGGLELGYGSDLDLVFLHNSMGEECETNGSKKIHNDIFFTRLVQRTIHILSTVTAGGKVFDTDLRLRPHGESGPVICSLHAYEKYLINDAWLWEHQALVRARAVTSSHALKDSFAKIRQKVLCQSRETHQVRASIIEMRDKMLSAKPASLNEVFDLKKDTGGVIDIEFIVQFLVLSNSDQYPQICEYTDNVRILDACAQVGLLKIQSAEELKEIYLKYRKYLHQLSLKLLPETVDGKVFAKQRATVQQYWTSLLHSDAS
jgi:glutamate-ammonia-ligase adenylyltransferase